MKKLLYVFFVLIGFSLHAQIAYMDSITVDGFGGEMIFKKIKAYNGKLFVLSDTIDNSLSYPRLHSSANPVSGDNNSFQPEPGINAVLQGGSESGLACMDTINGLLFFGSNTMGGPETPQVYRYDGSTYSMHGTINYTTYQPSDYYCISALQGFTVNGPTDTMYAFVQNINGTEIFKAAATNSSPTWNSVLDLPGVSKVTDAIEYHNVFYVATQLFMYGDAPILRSVNGVTFDTCNIGAFMGSRINALCVHNDTLIAFGEYANLWWTVDGVNWNNVNWFATTGDPGSYSVVDAISYDGHLCTVFSTFGNGFHWWVQKSPLTDMYLLNWGHTETNKPQLMSDYCSLENFGGKMYVNSYINTMALKPNTPGNQILLQQNLSSLWRFAFPVASYTVSGLPCEGNNMMFTGTSVNVTAEDWYINHNYYSSGNNMYYYCSTAGTFTVTYFAYNGPVVDSVQQVYNVLSSPTNYPFFSAVPSGTVCPGEPVTFTDYTTQTGGTPPYTYVWNVYDGQFMPLFGDSSLSNTTTLSFPGSAVAPIMLYHKVKDMNGCTSPTHTTTINMNPASDILGTAFYAPTSVISDGYAYLIKYSPSQSGGVIDTVQTSMIGTLGEFSFPSVDVGQYLVKIVPDYITFSNAIPTYYGDKWQWDSALVVNHLTCGLGNNDTTNVNVLDMPVASGPGTISGMVIEGVGYGNKMMIPGGPLKGIDVKAGTNPGGQILGRVMTDNSGMYSFPNLPLGSYRIYVDIPNYGMDSIREVTLTAGSPVVTNVNYVVDSNSIFPEDPTGIYPSLPKTEDFIKLFPNPSNGQFTILYQVEGVESVDISIYNLIGEKLFSLVSEANATTGYYEINVSREKLGLSSGNYFVKTKVGGKSSTIKLVIVE